ncbi:MAG: DUF3810 domain-containing protein [Bacteroidota bacterium]
MFFNAFPGITEAVYYKGLFVVIRYCLDYTICLLPIPLFYLLALCLIYLGFRSIKKAWEKRNIGTRIQKIKNSALTTGAVLGGIIFLFLFLWGFNYARLSIESQLEISPRPLDSLEVKNEVDYYTKLAAQARKEIEGLDTIAITKAFLPKAMEKKVRKDLEKALNELGFPTHGRVRGRMLFPEGILMTFGVAGVYIPFIGEGHVDAGLHPITHPYTMAHEMAHGYGFTDEGTCNFLAFLACSQSEDPVIRYSGYLSHTRDVLVAYRRVISDQYPEFRATLDKGVIADMNAINIANARFGRDWIPMYSINNLYLKSQGISEGILSYSRVVLLVKAFREKNQKPGIGK